jgi:23S rRNA U2552 (ribose-2'-O)-methylase RlmE/FtsJ
MNTLKEIYQQYCSDSPIDGGDKGTIHSYIDEYYEPQFSHYRESSKRILEIGINNGHSLKMWKDYFYNQEEIIGVDIKEIDLPDFNVIIGDATNPSTFTNIESLDVIVDDGSHKFKDQIRTFNILFPKLNKGGVYVIEDIVDIDRHRDEFLKLSKKVKIYDFRHIKNRSDDVIVEIRK